MQESDLGPYVDLVLHDLTSPLSTQQMWLSLLRSRMEDPAMRSRALDAIERCTQMQVHLVEELRELSRVFRGDVTIQNTVVSLSALVAAAIDRAQSFANDQAREIDVQLAPGVEIRGDAPKLARAVDRLLEHLGCVPGGRIAITLASAGGEIACTFAHSIKEHVERPSFALLYARAIVKLHAGTFVLREDSIELRFAT